MMIKIVPLVIIALLLGPVNSAAGIKIALLNNCELSAGYAYSFPTGEFSRNVNKDIHGHHFAINYSPKDKFYYFGFDIASGNFDNPGLQQTSYHSKFANFTLGGGIKGSGAYFTPFVGMHAGIGIALTSTSTIAHFMISDGSWVASRSNYFTYGFKGGASFYIFDDHKGPGIRAEGAVNLTNNATYVPYHEDFELDKYYTVKSNISTFNLRFGIFYSF